MSRGCSQGLVEFPFPLQFPLRNLEILIAKVVLFCIFIPGGCAFFPEESALFAIQFGSSEMAYRVIIGVLAKCRGDPASMKTANRKWDLLNFSGNAKANLH